MIIIALLERRLNLSNTNTRSNEPMALSLESWKAWGSCTVSDALRACDLAFQTMDGGIKPLAPELRLAGSAFTVRCYPGATWAMEQALEKAQPGDVLVVDAGGRDDLIIMGGLMSTRAQQRGLAGVVVDGAVRDVDDIVALNFPVFTRHVCSRAGTFAEIGELQTTLCCGRVPVSPDDWIVADNSGVVVVPKTMLDEVAKEAERVHLKENRMSDLLRQGKSLAEAAEEAKEKAT